jgi:DNA-binding NarL/FixJ family response regulator
MKLDRLVDAMSSARVLIIDDHPFFRSGLADWLNAQAGFVCCGEAGSYREARQALSEHGPDIVLIDLQLGDGDGLDLISELSDACPQTRFIALSQRDELVYAHRVLKAGARGYIMKSEATDTVLTALQTVLKGEIFVSRSVSARLLHNLFPDPLASKGELSFLSDRELQVFQLLGSGCKNREIASTLKISVKTVETYREKLKEKLTAADSEALRKMAERWIATGTLRNRPEPKD